MNPYLTPKNHARLKVKINLSSLTEIDCLIDTGYSGGIALPESYQSELKTKPLAFQEYELADGSKVIFAIYETKIQYKGVSKLVNLIFTKSEDSLLGIEFLNGFRFILDLKQSKVTLEN